MIVRRPGPALRPFVRLLWASSPGDAPADAPRLERVLPTGAMHLSIRLGGPPLRVYDGEADLKGRTLGHAVVGGARARFHLRDISQPSESVGAMLLPGAAEVLLGASAEELAGRHTRLEELWGRAVDPVRERLAEAADPERRLDLFEALLAARAPRIRGVHPAVAASLERFAVGWSVRAAVEDTGYSHRHFVALFRREVGLTPKVHCRLQRFQSALARLHSDPEAEAGGIAVEAGYSDQAHLIREFREVTGLTPGEYRRVSPRASHHVPVR